MTAPTAADYGPYTVEDSHEASALLSALRNMHCDQPHSIFGPPCERCLSTIHDALANALCVIRNTGIEKGRALATLSCMDNPDHSPDSLAFKLREQGRAEMQAKLDAAEAKLADEIKWSDRIAASLMAHIDTRAVAQAKHAARRFLQNKKAIDAAHAAARAAHDAQCESEFDSQVHAQTPCGCAARKEG